MKYRREIDGTRAIAVLLVILFHAGFETFSGGFVGVDVFFVISGYLITSIILADLEQGKMSVGEFYERRARRILPALFLIMLACIPLAWLWLPSGGMKDFSQSLVAVSVFGSNFLFWHESGYFDTGADLKPLLHTWSLAVEEQYYILFPGFMLLCWRWGKRWLVALLAVAGVASLLCSYSASVHRSPAGFYLLPSRGWELVIGALAAVYLSEEGRAKFGKTVGEVGGWLGVALILASAFAYSRSTPFPGLYALLPTIGALLIIVFATGQTTVGTLMGSKVLVGIGLVSYSAYLWHHVLFAFARNSRLSEPGSAVFAALIVATFLLAYLSWSFVEKPFRTRSRFSRKQVFAFSLLGTLFFAVLGTLGHWQNGFAKESDQQILSTAKRTDRNFVVLGDSHAAHLLGGLKAITSGHLTDYTHSGCIPFRNVDRYDSRFAPGTCVAWVNADLDRVIAQDPNATVVLSSMGPAYLDGTAFHGKDTARVTGLGMELVSDRSVKDRAKVFEIGLRSTLAELSRLKNARVVVAIDVPELGIDQGCARGAKEIAIGPFAMTDAVATTSVEDCFVPRQSYDQRASAYKALVKRVAGEFPGVLVFDPTDAFCDGARCKGVDRAVGFLYSDSDHLSEAGSWYFAARFVQFLGAP